MGILSLRFVSDAAEFWLQTSENNEEIYCSYEFEQCQLRLHALSQIEERTEPEDKFFYVSKLIKTMARVNEKNIVVC